MAEGISLVAFVSVSHHIKTRMINFSFVFRLVCLTDKCIEGWKYLDDYKQ